MRRWQSWVWILVASIWSLGSKAAPPPEVQELLDQGVALLEQDRHKEALKPFQRAAEMGGVDCFDCKLGLARVHRRLGNHKESLEHAANAIGIGAPNPSLVVAHSEAGLALLSMEKGSALEEAVEHFRQGLELSGGQVPVLYFNMGFTLLRLEKDQEGVAALKKFVELAPAGRDVERARSLIDRPLRSRENVIPAFSAPTLDGENLTDHDFDGKVVLFDFWATWCAPCRAALPHLRKLNQSFEDSPFVLLGVSSDQSRETLMSFVEEEEMVWPQIHDARGAVSAQAFGVRSYPTYVLVDHEGRVVFRRSGWSPNIARDVSLHVKRAVKKLKKSQASKNSTS